MAQPPSTGNANIPIFLLKTESSPSDAYRDLFSTNAPTAENEGRFLPRFVPVLQHRFEESGMSRLRTLLHTRRISREPSSSYGGLIFTSQRAVEAFAKLVQDDNAQGDASWPHLQDIPVYSVGPATSRALKAIPQSPTPLQIFGEHTGNGQDLAHFILDHYAEWYPDREPKPPLLFLVGEQRRDIIPKTLMDEGLPSSRRVPVDEETVYGTGVMESFPNDFSQVLSETSHAPERWVVVFSPTGCDGMLQEMGLLDTEAGKAIKPAESSRDDRTFVATIGPTTQQYLRTEFEFEPDVCAEEPSPEGVLRGILYFQSKRSNYPRAW